MSLVSNYLSHLGHDVKNSLGCFLGVDSRKVGQGRSQLDSGYLPAAISFPPPSVGPLCEGLGETTPLLFPGVGPSGP